MRKNGYKLKDDGPLTRGLASATHYLFQPMFLIEGEMNSFVTLAKMIFFFFLKTYIKYVIATIYTSFSLDLFYMF